MATNQMSEAIQHLRRTMVPPDGAGMTDGQLLKQYVESRDEDAFAALVKRHGPMVWGVCRCMLANHQDTEDAFQATFLVLVRKAATVHPREMVANWLYGVASMTAHRNKVAAAKGQRREKQGMKMPEPFVSEPDLGADLRPLLDQELSRLPNPYRVVVVLCELEGKTRKEAARQLGLPEGTVASRLGRAKAMLAKRLARHGRAVSGAALAAVLAQNVGFASMPTSVMISTIKAASLFAAGQVAATGLLSAPVVALTEGVVKAMLLTKLKVAGAALFMVLGLVALGGGLAARQTEAAQKEGEKFVTNQGDQPKQPDLSDKAKDQAPKLLETLNGHTGPVNGVAFSPDGKTLATGGDKTIRLWDVATGKELAVLKGHTNVTAVAFNPDGNTLASGSRDGSIRLWDKATGRILAILKVHTGPVHPLAYSPDGKVLASGSDDHTINLWDAATGKLLATFKGHTAPVYSLAFSPDGKTLASGSDDKTIKFWEVATGKEGAIIKGHAKTVYCVAFSPDGKKLASVSCDHSVKLWDLATGKELAALQGHTKAVYAVAYSPDGKTLASGGDDNTIKLWDVATGKELATLQGHTDVVCALAYSPDGKTLASGSWDQTAKLWTVKTGK